MTAPNLNKTLSPVDIAPIAHSRLDYRVFVEPDVTLEEFENPSFWMHVAKTKFDQKGSILPLCEAVWKDKSKVVDFYVVEVAEGAARIHIKTVTLIHGGNETVKIAVDEFDIKHQGRGKFRVYRKSDGALLVENLDGKEAARAFITEYAEKLRKAA
jgi:hypothetical protein